VKAATRTRVKRVSRTAPIEELLEGKVAPRYRLRLYVAGNNLNSFHAIENVEKLCRGPLRGRAQLEIIDLYQQPGLACRDRIVAAPCLMKLYPDPPRRLIGDLSDWKRVLKGLSLNIPLPVSRIDGDEGKR
jgi:circadian clock protein KaiB